MEAGDPDFEEAVEATFLDEASLMEHAEGRAMISALVAQQETDIRTVHRLFPPCPQDTVQAKGRQP